MDMIKHAICTMDTDEYNIDNASIKEKQKQWTYTDKKHEFVLIHTSILSLQVFSLEESRQDICLGI